MLFCAACAVKNCAKRMGEEGSYPHRCPSFDPVLPDMLEEYQKPEALLLARVSAQCAPDHEECRLLKTIRFAKMCGFQKLGLAFCSTLRTEAQEVDAILRAAGFEVASIICKVGHQSREVIGITDSCNPMCNPFAQADLLNRENTQLNILLGLCVGHDAMFISRSNALVTVLATKDHVYDHAPLEYLKQNRKAD